MGKKIKKGKEGPSKEYISRARAIKKLQVSLKDFRRLCILKGVYPRDPPKKLRKTNKTYYHIKDINYLNHETILEKFREKKAHIKKIKRAVASGQKLKASKLRQNTPRYNLDHLVKERYPAFADALNDLDDPLSLISLFASFPAHKEHKIPNEVVLNCQRLMKQFLVYIAKSHSLRKVFLSIKGIYYQAVVQGSTVTWIQPYPISPSMPLDVDYKVMTTFLEFYQVLLRFINYKLLGSELNFGVSACIGTEYRNHLQDEENKRKKDDKEYNIDEKFQDDEQVKQIQNKQKEDQYSNFFSNLVFQLSTEAPRASLEFVILSYGGRVCWTGDGQNIDDKLITHIVTERTLEKSRTKEHVQPQWVYDSINKLVLQPVSDYAPEKILPPHLSPFDDEQINQQMEEEQVDDESDQDATTNPKIEAPVHDAKKAQKNMKKQKIFSKEEQQRLAESTLTRKNKRLYDMVKKKEAEKQDKVNNLQNKKKQINSQKGQ